MKAARFVLREMKRAADSAGATLIVVYIPWYFDPQVPDTPAALVAICSELGIHLIGMTDVFRSLKERNRPIRIEGDGHPNAETNAAMAEVIISYVRRIGI